LFIRTPVPSTNSAAPNGADRLVIQATALPSRSAAARQVVSPAPASARSRAVPVHAVSGSIDAACAPSAAGARRRSVASATKFGSPAKRLRSAKARFSASIVRWTRAASLSSSDAARPASRMPSVSRRMMPWPTGGLL